MSKPLTEEQAVAMMKKEKFGGILEGNRPVPPAIAALLVITVFTAFLVTFPLWGARPEVDPTHWSILEFGNSEPTIVEKTFLNAEHQSPWWDIGYTLAIPWVIAFFATVGYVIRQLPEPFDD
jgi:hypothetical protein